MTTPKTDWTIIPITAPLYVVPLDLRAAPRDASAEAIQDHLDEAEARQQDDIEAHRVYALMVDLTGHLANGYVTDSSHYAGRDWAPYITAETATEAVEKARAYVATIAADQRVRLARRAASTSKETP